MTAATAPAHPYASGGEAFAKAMHDLFAYGWHSHLWSLRAAAVVFGRSAQLDARGEIAAPHAACVALGHATRMAYEHICAWIDLGEAAQVCGHCPECVLAAALVECGDAHRRGDTGLRAYQQRLMRAALLVAQDEGGCR